MCWLMSWSRILLLIISLRPAWSSFKSSSFFSFGSCFLRALSELGLASCRGGACTGIPICYYMAVWVTSLMALFV